MEDGSRLPLLVYDGDCAFCKYWIEYWRGITGDRVSYAPYQEVAERFPEIPLESFQRSVQLIEPDRRISGGAEAVFRSLACAPEKRWLLWMYDYVPGFAAVSELIYAWVARYRGPLYRVTRLLWGRRPQPPCYVLTGALFVRLLGFVYLLAFASWFKQVPGLIGDHGILPVAAFLDQVHEHLGARGYLLVPTLAWLHASGGFVRGLAAAGLVVAGPVLFGLAAGPCLLLLWMLYLSQVSVGGDFLGFQWDALLLEAGFLAVFVAPWTPRRAAPARPPSSAVLWLLRWLLFRVMFLSGATKLLSHDPNWRNLGALRFHYQTQPLPNMVSWYAHQLPDWFQRGSTAAMFGIELAVPFLIFFPRRFRLAAAFILTLFQSLIAFTGNYAFFNVLVVVLCVPLLDDAFLRRVLPEWVVRRLERPAGETPPRESRSWQAARLARAALVAAVLSLSLLQMARHLSGDPPEAGDAASRLVAPFYLVNSYGLFSIMTTERHEIVLEGSDDRQTWLPYEFRYKPGDPGRAPPWVAPYQPRLDWQMWFAALSSFRSQPWFINLAVRLLQGSPDVLRLLASNPFPNRPPRYIRAVIYDYRFTTRAEKRASGQWWKRELLGEYLPPISRDMLR